MFKNVKVLRKEENLENKYSSPSVEEKLKTSRLIPLAISEVNRYSSLAPIIISGNHEKEFALYVGLSASKNILTNSDYIDEPQFLKNHPLTIIKVKNEQNEDVSVIGIDNNTKYLSKDKEISIFSNDELSKTFEEKIKNVKILEFQRQISKDMIKEFEKHNLLQEQTFNIRVDGEVKPIIDGYFIVNREKLNELDDTILALWAKKGWMGIIDAHLYSLRNFQKLVELIK